jgi:hypothetical protein
MVWNWKAWKLHAFNGKQQVKWFEEICVLFQTLVARGMCYCVIATYSSDSGLLWYYAPLIYQELFTTQHGTTPQKTWIFITSTVRTQNLRLWLPVTKIHTVIITAAAVQVVTAFSRQGQFHDCDSIILLPLRTDLLYSDCMTCHSHQAIMTYRCILWGVVSHVGATRTAEYCFTDETFHFDKHIK